MSRTGSRETSRSYDILLVDGDPDTVSPFIEAFRTTDATEDVHVVTDGDEALDFVHQRGDYEDVPRPDLIILDLYVPGTSGEEILRKRNEEPEFRQIPVLVFTESESAEDVVRSYELQANAYIRKPDSPERYNALAQAIEGFWLEQARLPPA